MIWLTPEDPVHPNPLFLYLAFCLVHPLLDLTPGLLGSPQLVAPEPQVRLPVGIIVAFYRAQQ